MCFCLALSAISAQSQTIGGITAVNIDFNGNGVICDSFDSSDTNHSIWQTNLFFRGMNYGIWSNSLSYNTNSLPSLTANFHAAATANLIDVGYAKIYGYIDAAPGGVYNISHAGSVGDLNWVHSGTLGLQPGHFRDDMNMTFTSLPLPNPATRLQSSWLPIATGTVGGTNVICIGSVYSNGILIGNGTLYTNKNNAGWIIGGITYLFVITNRPATTNYIYYAADSLNSTSSLFIDSPFTVLYLTNGMSSPRVTLNTNADVIIYSGGDITPGIFSNLTANIRAFQIRDISGKPITIITSGNALGIFTLYVPSSSVTFNGGGNNTYDLVGEITAYSVELNGHFNFHFDESLATILPIPPSISQLSAQAVLLGSNATFTAVSDGAPPISYFWYFAPSNLVSSGTNLTSLTLTNVQFSDAGNYYLKATNSFGSATSPSVLLFVYTNSAQLVPQLDSSLIPTNGRFQFNVDGVTGLDYTVQASTNLVDWIILRKTTSPFIFTDFNTNVSHRFYRAGYFP